MTLRDASIGAKGWPTTGQSKELRAKGKAFYDKVMAAKKASGRNVREDERSTIQVKLRLPPDVADDLDDLARRWNLTRSGAVARLVEDATDATSGGEKT